MSCKCRSTSPDGDQGVRPPKIFDVDPERRRERERQLAIRQAELELAGDGAVKEKPKEDPKAEVGFVLKALARWFERAVRQRSSCRTSTRCYTMQVTV